MTASPLDAEDVGVRVQKVLEQFLEAQRPVLDDMSEDLSPLVDALSDLLVGGKRLRPAFCYWGWRGAGGPDDQRAVVAASALELLQACALVHDDVMDASDTRRGQPSAHRRFATLHGRSGWSGSSESFGTGAAILLGDLCLSWTDELIYGSGMDAVALARAKPVLDIMRTELMAGQYLDLLEQARGGGSTARALRVLRYKSAKYTVERPLHLGGVLAGADDATLRWYTSYGLPLGEAFQLRDDVLGVFGDPGATGKPAGDDLREGKRTVLVAAALDRATPQQAAVVKQHLGNPALDASGVDALRCVIAETGALAHVEALIDKLLGRSLDALDRSAVMLPARDVLHGLAVAATSRTV